MNAHDRRPALGVLSLLASVLACGTGGAPDAENRAELAITTVTVIDPASGEATRGRTVLIGERRVLAIGSAWRLRVPPGVEVVDGSGRYLVPGLWDVHLPGVEDTATLSAYLANGVTALRAASAPSASPTRREAASVGERIGPRIVVAGPAAAAGVVASGSLSVEAVLTARRHGAELLADPAAEDRGPEPGLALHDELARLVEAGLTPMEALRTATWHPARAAGVSDSLGWLGAGAVADLVLLNADPLEEIRHTRLIAAAILGGRLLGRRELDRLLAAARALSTTARPR